MNMNVKEWYCNEYPNDEMGDGINSKITFEEVLYTLDNYLDIYELMCVYDSIIRERVFEKLSELTGRTYDEIYHKWLKA